MEVKNLRALNTNATSDSTGNYYPRHVMEVAVEKFLEKNKGRQIFGELRPRNYQIASMERQMQIVASEISHELLDLRFEDDVLVADIKVLDLPAGDLLKKLIPLDHEELHVKSRDEVGMMLGLRSLVSYGSNMADMQRKEVNFCDIITFDVIYDPLKIPDHYPGVLFMNHDGETVIPKIWWERDKGSPGIFHATYLNRQLTIKPVGCSEWDGLIDGVIQCGTDDLEELERRLMGIVDGVEFSKPRVRAVPIETK